MIGIAGPRVETRPAGPSGLFSLSRAELAGWITLGLAEQAVWSPIVRPGTLHAGRLDFNAPELIACWCALLLLRGAERRPVGVGLFCALLALLGAAAILPQRLCAAPMLAAALLIRRGAGDGEARAGLVLAAVALRRLVAGPIMLLFGDLLLRLDTAAAGALMQWVVPGSTWTANLLKPPHDVGVTVGTPCSSFANLSIVCLCFVSFLHLDRGRMTARAWLGLAAACATVIACNTARLIVVASSMENFRYWHDGDGAGLFGVAVTMISIALCSAAARWASS